MNNANNPSTLAVIPCYNEEATIGSVIIRAKRHVKTVLVVDDGSTDDTAKIAKDAGAVVLSHKKNMGKSAGIKTGFKYALIHGFDYVVTIDGVSSGELQHEGSGYTNFDNFCIVD